MTKPVKYLIINKKVYEIVDLKLRKRAEIANQKADDLLFYSRQER